MRRLLLAAIVAALLLPGCASKAPHAAGLAPTGGDAADLQPGSFYSFRHGGGALGFAVENGTAEVEIHDGQDHRIGRFVFGSEDAHSLSIASLPAGQPVVHVLALNGTLRISSAGQPVRDFGLLTPTIERIVLANRPPDAVSSIAGTLGTGGQPLDSKVDNLFARSPSDLRVLASGSYRDLRIEVHTEHGVALDVAGVSSTPFLDAASTANDFLPVPSTLHPENLSEGRGQSIVHASSFTGALVLEATTYSRAPMRVPAGMQATVDVVRFTYARLPDQPVELLVDGEATALYLWQEGQANPNATALVALFGPQDQNLGTVLVPGNGTVRIPVASGGSYVAVLRSGQASIGSDVVPANFDLRPLQTVVTDVPDRVAGQSGTYGQDNESVAPTGVPFAIAASYASVQGDMGGPFVPDTGVSCNPDRFVRLDQSGETIDVADPQETDPHVLEAAQRLDGGPLTAAWDGFGSDTCQDHLVLAITGYVR